MNFFLKDGSFGTRAGGALLKAPWALEILQMRVTAQAWKDVSKYGPYCELFFFLMKCEPDLT